MNRYVAVVRVPEVQMGACLTQSKLQDTGGGRQELLCEGEEKRRLQELENKKQKAPGHGRQEDSTLAYLKIQKAERQSIWNGVRSLRGE